jgi:hypothetical protein
MRGEAELEEEKDSQEALEAGRAALCEKQRLGRVCESCNSTEKACFVCPENDYLYTPLDESYEAEFDDEEADVDSDLTLYPLTKEQYREYDVPGRPEPYRITSPQQLYWKPGATTHRVVDAEGKVHCVPAPGTNGCVLRWKTIDEDNPVQF